MFLPRFNFPKDTFSRIGHKVAKRCSCENLEKGRGNDSCHFPGQYFLPCFLCKHPTILFQNKNGIFQHKNQTVN